ncbi:hypothetical protein MUK42_08241 [Musa troglodytarum]|uniref:Uncharacterized protein n=1 Tax=Musa troglodytarum TaxID=320322 RepID=A0A9E7JCP9_9LILI|nr:hypothetical protein MUK42_08241 [Musa troglodytarum]
MTKPTCQYSDQLFLANCCTQVSYLVVFSCQYLICFEDFVFSIELRDIPGEQCWADNKVQRRRLGLQGIQILLEQPQLTLPPCKHQPMQPGRPAFVHEVRIRGERNNGYLGVICDAISLCSEIEHIEHGCLHRILCYRV